MPIVNFLASHPNCDITMPDKGKRSKKVASSGRASMKRKASTKRLAASLRPKVKDVYEYDGSGNDDGICDMGLY